MCIVCIHVYSAWHRMACCTGWSVDVHVLMHLRLCITGFAPRVWLRVANTWEFAAITGCGDMTGVFVGHSLYKAGQSLVSKDVSVADEIGTVSHAQQQNLIPAHEHAVCLS